MRLFLCNTYPKNDKLENNIMICNIVYKIYFSDITNLCIQLKIGQTYNFNSFVAEFLSPFNASKGLMGHFGMILVITSLCEKHGCLKEIEKIKGFT